MVPASPFGQLAQPVEHVASHAPPTHFWPPAHTLPQVPQLSSLVSVSTQALLQSVRPVWHEAAQLPAEQTWPPEHTLPQPPQLFGSLF